MQGGRVRGGAAAGGYARRLSLSLSLSNVPRGSLVAQSTAARERTLEEVEGVALRRWLREDLCGVKGSVLLIGSF